MMGSIINYLTRSTLGVVAAIGYTPFFICLGVLDLLGAVILWTLVREPHAERTPAAAF